MSELFDQRGYRTTLIGVFLALSWAPFLGSLAGVGGDVAKIELRQPAELPGLPTTWEDLRVLPRNVDAYLDDAFGFRSQLVTANSLLHLAVGVSGSERYLVGRDGWFFYRTVDNIHEQFRGIENFSGDELDRWIETMQKRKAWLAKRGIDFLIVIAPAKQSIYPEFLPSWVNVVGPTRYEQLRRRLDDLPHEPDIDVLDLHEPLRRAKERAGERLYHKTDGHWNEIGAFVAYEEIARWIQARYPKVLPLSREDFSVTWKTRGVGAITRGLNIRRFRREPVPMLELTLPSSVVSTEELGYGRKFSPTYVLRTRTDLLERPKVLFIRDSFATPLAGFLSETVSETVLTHHWGGLFNPALIEKHKPDIVIYEMVEPGLRWDLSRSLR